MEEIPNDGLIRFHGIFNQERLLLTTSEGVRDVLITNPYHFHKQRAQKIHLGPVSGRGLVFVEGDTHKFHRKQMSPAFSTRYIRDCQTIFWRKTKQVVDFYMHKIESQSGVISADNEVPSQHEQDSTTSLSQHLGRVDLPLSSDDQDQKDTFTIRDKTHMGQSGIVEVHEPVSRAALDIIGVAGCSFDFDSLQKDESENTLVKNYRKAFGVSTSNRIRCLLAHAVPAWVTDNVPLQRNKDIAVVVRSVGALARSIIHAKKQRKSLQLRESDILDKAMRNDVFSDDVLVEQVKTLFAAGHDTTSSTLASAAVMLSKPEHQHIQERLRTEIRSRLPSLDEESLASAKTIEDMPYLTAVSNEVLRLFAPFSWYFRRSVVATTICGHAVPAGTDIMLCPWGLHRSKDHWGADADIFNPGRWLNDPSGKGGAKDSCCFATFGAGPRVCIAERFAKNEIMTLMAGLFGRFLVEKVEEIQESPLSHQLTLTWMRGVQVRMTLLEGW